MPTENELEELTNNFLDGTMHVKGADFNGKAEQIEELGIVAECGKSDCVPCKNVCEG